MTILKELKLKAKVLNRKDARNRIRKHAAFLRREKFVDYFFKSDSFEYPSELRLRKSNHEKVIKLKVLLSRDKDKIQENAEYMFTVDRADDFVNFLEYLGFEPCSLLHKESEVYAYNNIEIRLTTIRELGNYVELVALTKGQFIRQNKEKLIRLSDQLCLKKEMIDSRYYCDIA